MSADSSTPVEELSRQELENEVFELRSRVDRLEDWFFDLEDAISGDVSMGVVQTKAEEGESVVERIQKLEQGEVETAEINESIRHELVPIHRMMIDIENDEFTASVAERRGARLFRRFIWKLSKDEPHYEIDKSGGYLKISGSTARRVLEEENDATAQGMTTTVKRAMGAVQGATKDGECECPNRETCDHGLFVWKPAGDSPDSEHTLRVDLDEFEQYLERVQHAVEGDLDGTDDAEGGNSAEASQDTDDEANEVVSQSTHDDEFAALDAADAVQSETDDSLEASIEANGAAPRGGDR